jgi:hypothetical protein
MRGFQPHGDSARPDELDERVRDLFAHALLDGEAACVQPHEPRQLRDPDDLRAGDVSDMCNAVKGKRVVLTERVECNRPFGDLAMRTVDSVRPLARKRRVQLGIAVVAGGRIVQRLQESPRRVECPRRAHLHAERAEDLADVALVAAPVVRRDHPRLALLEARGQFKNGAQMKTPLGVALGHSLFGVSMALFLTTASVVSRRR